MKLETFFEKFDRFANAPDAVAKMREVIMSWAFSGSLSTEKRDNPMPAEWAIEGAPMLLSIPASWKWQRGSEVFDVIRGVSYQKHDASDIPVEGSFPLLRANNIGNGINLDNLVYVRGKNIREEQFVRRGDILIAMSSGSKKLVGKAAPIATEFKGSFGAFCGVIRNKSEIPDAVLARYFESPQYTSWVTAAGRGIGINNLKKGDLDSLPIPIPPLAEQKRIVAKVDELMALCDQLEAQQQEREKRHAKLARASLARFADAPTPDNLQFLFHQSYTITPDDLRKSILTLAVQGKLVPHDPGDEPAEELLAQSRVNLKRWKVADDEQRHKVPETWVWIRFAGVGEQRLGKMLDAAKNKGELKSYLRNTNVQWMLFKLDDVKKMPIETREEDELRLKKDDLLICEGGEPGRCAIWDDQEPEMYFQKALHRVRPCKAILSQFLALNLQLDSRNDVLATYFTGATIKHLTGRSLEQYPIPIPPLAEQQRIVAKVDQLMALVDQLEAQLAASRATAAKLMEALVAELTALH